MHNAPAVSYPVGRCRFQTVVLGILLLAVPLVVALWQSQADVGNRLQEMSWGLVLLSVGVALASWWRTPSGLLQWDGSQWIWQGDRAQPISGRVAVSLDWQRGMLLEFHASTASRRWLWLARSRDPLNWPALRRAAFAEVGAAAPTNGVGDPA